MSNKNKKSITESKQIIDESLSLSNLKKTLTHSCFLIQKKCEEKRNIISFS